MRNDEANVKMTNAIQILNLFNNHQSFNLQSIPQSSTPKSSMHVISIACLAFVLSSTTLLAQTRVRVEFTAAGECIVSTASAVGRAKVKYARRTPEWRCEVTALAKPPAGERFELEVVLPEGSARPSGEFPRLSWSERDGRWTGVASLPAPPAFVRLPAAGQGLDRWRSQMLDVTVLAATILAIAWSVVRGRRS